MKNYSIKLSKKDIFYYSDLLGLPYKTSLLLTNGELIFESISDCAKNDLKKTAKRILSLDCYKDDFNVKLEKPSCIEYLISPKGLDGKGYFLVLRGKDIGYCLIYPVKNECKKDTPVDYVNVNKRANWNQLVKYLRKVFDSEFISLGEVYHHYDYAIKPVKLRHCGFGRLILRCTLDNFLPKGSVSIGFIDYMKHSSSITSASKAGCLIGKKVFPSPDGNHSSFVELFSRDINVNFSNKGVGYVHKKDSFDILPNAVHKIVDKRSTKNLVGFNKDIKSFDYAVVNYV